MQTVALAVLVLSTCAALLLAPDFGPADLIEPAVGAAVSTPFVLAALVVARVAGWPVVVERGLLAAFLAFMPAVYLGSIALHGAPSPWPVVEIAGQVLFATIAVVGFRRAGWLLALGIASHGLFWDAWHYGQTTFIPDWYTLACLVVDVGWGFYAFSRLAAWNAEERRAVAPIARVATAR